MSKALLEEYSSSAGSGVRDNYLGAISGEPRFGFYETFTYVNGHHGLIQKSYERSEIAEAFNLSFFNGQGYGYMLSQDGDILRQSDYVINDTVYTNIFETLADLDYQQEDIDAASQHLLSLINDVLDMNKIESGSTTLSISEISLADIINELNTIIRPRPGQRARPSIFALPTWSMST